MDYLDIPFRHLDLVSNQIDQLKFLAYGVVFWFTLFYIVNETIKFKNLDKRKSDDTKNRIISIIHGLGCFIYSLRWIMRDDPQFGTLNTNYQMGTILGSTAYFLYDSIACFYYGLLDFGCFAHHTMVLLGYGSCVFQHYGATEALLGLFFAEVSNFPMHARVILRSFNLRYTKIYEVLELVYMVSYIIARSIMIPFALWIHCIQAEKCPFIVKFICTGLTVQSLYYIKEMYGILLRKYKQLKERKQKKISYFWFSENAKVKDLSYANKEAKQNIF
ncbi:hypothetical protein ABPG74_013750 [Tetrahymena malaccensis]